MNYQMWRKEVNVLMATKMLPEDFLLGTVTVGERGQIVIPAEARKKFDIQPGEKLLMMSHPNGQGLMFMRVGAIRELLNHLAASVGMAEEGGTGKRQDLERPQRRRSTKPKPGK